MTAGAHAQYPNRPLRYIVPQAPGSASDTSARIIAHESTRILGQQAVVDNRPGGGLVINRVMRSTPEEYGALIRREVEKYTALAKTLKLKVDRGSRPS